MSTETKRKWENETTDKALRKICEDYDVAGIMDILDNNEDELGSSIQSGYCGCCGRYHGSVEPDARNYECGGCGELAVRSITEFLLF